MVALVLAGCVQQPGFSGRDNELNRARGAVGPFNVVSINHERAVVSAKGRQVAIEAAEGFCLAQESIETSGRSAFAMIGDCVLDDPKAASELPNGVPGIITVSISGDRGYTRDGDGAGSLTDLSKFLKTNEGRKMLGRGGAEASVSIKESRTIGDGLYVLVEDKNTQLVPILAPRFWRSFVDLNDRLTVVTISSFRDKPLGKDVMLKYLVNQVKTLAQANRVPLNEPRTLVAEADTSRQDTAQLDPTKTIQALADLTPEAVSVTAENQQEDVYSPLPQIRPETQSDAEPEGEVIEAPDASDPAIDVEIALATETIPVPTPRGGAPAEAEAVDPDSPEETAAEEKPEDADPAQTAAADTAAAAAAEPQEGTAKADVADNEAAPAKQEADLADNEAAPAKQEADMADNEAAPAKQEADMAENDAAPAKQEAAPATDAEPEAEAVATTDAAQPQPDTTPTANAPQNAPQAPRRPKRG